MNEDEVFNIASRREFSTGTRLVFVVLAAQIRVAPGEECTISCGDLARLAGVTNWTATTAVVKLAEANCINATWAAPGEHGRHRFRLQPLDGPAGGG